MPTSDIVTVECAHCHIDMEVEQDNIEYLEDACPADANVKYLCEDCYTLYSAVQLLSDDMESKEVH